MSLPRNRGSESVVLSATKGSGLLPIFLAYPMSRLASHGDKLLCGRAQERPGKLQPARSTATFHGTPFFTGVSVRYGRCFMPKTSDVM